MPTTKPINSLYLFGTPLGFQLYLFFPPSPLPHNMSAQPNLKVFNLISSNGHWNFPLLVSLFTISSVLKIMKIHINPSPSSSFLWTSSSYGSFSTSSAHKLINNNRICTTTSPMASSFWKSLWKLKLNARLVLFPLENCLGYLT